MSEYKFVSELGDRPLTGGEQGHQNMQREERWRASVVLYRRPEQRDGCHTCASAKFKKVGNVVVSWKCLTLTAEVEPFARCGAWHRGRPLPECQGAPG